MRGWEIRHLCAPSPACRGGRASLAVTARSWPVVRSAHSSWGGCSSWDAAPLAPGSMCACQPGAVDEWAPSCAHPIPPPPPRRVPPCPTRMCRKRCAGFSSGRALCFSMPALKLLAVFSWRFANEREGAASAACAMGRALAAGSRWEAGNHRTHLGATWEPASSHRRPCGYSSPPIPRQSGTGAGGGTWLETVGRMRRWGGLGGPSPQGAQGRGGAGLQVLRAVWERDWAQFALCFGSIRTHEGHPAPAAEIRHGSRAWGCSWGSKFLCHRGHGHSQASSCAWQHGAASSWHAGS